METKQKMDYNSSVNQDIKGQFVQREVYTCFSYEMDSILKMSYEVSNNDLPTWEDIENAYEPCCPDCENTDLETKLGYYYCSYCKKAYNENDLDSRPQEIFEWWIISEYLYRKLKGRGYCVLEWGNNYYWGRCTTGQAILLDYVISSICEEMEILEGQKYSWERK